MQDIKLDFCYKLMQPAAVHSNKNVRSGTASDAVGRRFERIEKEAALIAASSP
jgi:hypothetical protein